MPLELCYIPDGEFEEEQHHLVMPGQGIYFNDYYDEQPEKFALVCNPRDDGGNFLILVDTPQDGETTELPDSKESTEIVEGGEYRRIVASEEGEEATMIVRHVGYSSIQFAKLASPN